MSVETSSDSVAHVTGIAYALAIAEDASEIVEDALVTGVNA